MPDTQDKSDPAYFYKQVMENCQEQMFFTPSPDTLTSIPPSFIYHPFTAQEEANLGTSGKINPTNQNEYKNYNSYIWSKPYIFKPDTTNLLKITESQNPITNF